MIRLFNFRSGFGLFLGIWALGAATVEASDSTYVRFNTSLGNIDVQMLSDEAPMNVANFMGYVNGTTNNYNNSIIHRSVPGFIIQGGSVDVVNSQLALIGSNGTVTGEPGVSNQRGTLAMALSNGPNSATNNWFFNLVNNSAALDGTADGGPFTVFGKVTNTSSLAVMDALANVPVYPGLFQANSTDLLYDLPLLNYTPNPINYTPGSPSPAITFSNLVYINSISVLYTTDFTAWEAGPFAGMPASVSAPTATPQNDGVTNLMKYAFDITPAAYMTATDRAKLPVVGSTTASGTTYLTLTYRLRANLVGVFVNVQTSTDLATWAAPTNATMTPTTATDGSGDTIMQVKVPAPTTGVQFIRLSVSQ